MPGRKRSRLPPLPLTTRIESLNEDGTGHAEGEQRPAAVADALPGELVRFQVRRRSGGKDLGLVEEVLEWPHPQRAQARCRHYPLCSGCALQHLQPHAQIALKQERLLDCFERHGGLRPAQLAAPLRSPLWGYRRKARLGARYVTKKGRLLVGFRERFSSKVAELERCEVLHPVVGERLGDLSRLIQTLPARDAIPQLEVAVGERAAVVILRHLRPLSEAEKQSLAEFAEHHGLRFALQPGGPRSIHPLLPGQSLELSYALPEFDLRLGFSPIGFTQVNFELNRAMVHQALEWLSPGPEEGVLDLFCGIGNFSLPTARRAGRVLGIEGEEQLVRRAEANARVNRIDNASFRVADLMHPEPVLQGADVGAWDKVIVDPPRSGAAALMPLLGAMKPARIVYVACHPETLARDVRILVESFGYRLHRTGVMDMFPHTAHVESMAWLERG
jgi:23S rRNA (uracil1939-C5)-methyltransferase